MLSDLRAWVEGSVVLSQPSSVSGGPCTAPDRRGQPREQGQERGNGLRVGIEKIPPGKDCPALEELPRVYC